MHSINSSSNQHKNGVGGEGVAAVARRHASAPRGFHYARRKTSAPLVMPEARASAVALFDSMVRHALDGDGTIDVSPVPLTENSLEIATKRYLRKDAVTGAVLETPQQLFARVALKLASNAFNYVGTGCGTASGDAESPEETAERVFAVFRSYYSTLRRLEFVPAGRTLANDKSVVPNCIVLHIQDSMEGIFQTLKDAALLQKAGSGLGFPLHLMRPTGCLTRTAGGHASGPVSFLHVYNTAFGVIKQQNRHGANMAIMKVSHPDILEFIHCKRVEGEIRNFNISVALERDFMEQVISGSTEPWVPHFGGVKYTLRRIVRPAGQYTRHEHQEVRMTAKELFHEIITAAWRNGEPGCVFLDRVNETNPLPGLGEIHSSNPCVTADTWVSTDHGPRQVRDLLGSRDGLGVVLPDGRRAAASVFFSTGVKNVVRVETDEGVALTCTPNHRLLTADGGWVEAARLKPGARLSVFCVEQRAWQGRGTEAEGYLLGLLKGDGVIKARQAVLSVWSTSGPGHREFMAAIDAAVFEALGGASYTWTEVSGRNEFRLQSAPLVELAERFGLLHGEKRVGDLIEGASRAFYVGFLRGLFDTDGSVQGSSAKGRSVRLSQSDAECLERVQRMLLRLGVMSRIRSRRAAGARALPDGSGGLKEYVCKEQFELIISCESIARFARTVHFARPHKRAALDEMIATLKRRPNADRLEAHVRSVRALDAPEEVFDTSVLDDSHAYDSNGLVSHNCGEQFLHDGDVCNLGSLNLARFVDTATGRLDEARLEAATAAGIRMLEDVVDTFDLPVERVEKTAKATRRLGLGVMGFAEYLVLRGIQYDSQECLDEIGRVMSVVKRTAEATTRELAKERGVFAHFDKSIYAATGDRRRNAFLTCVAPTGTISMFANVNGGIEPFFMLCYVKKNILGGRVFNYACHPLLRAALEREGLDTDEILDEISQKGSVADMRGKLPERIVRVFRTAGDISAEWHVKVQIEFQKWVDNAISKTCNFPQSATVEDVEKAYIMAYQGGCKGLTVYRNNSRQEQVLESVADHERKEREKKKSLSVSVDSAPSSEKAARKFSPKIADSSSGEQSVTAKNYCPECKTGAHIVHAEGCVTCSACAWSACS